MLSWLSCARLCSLPPQLLDAADADARCWRRSCALVVLSSYGPDTEEACLSRPRPRPPPVVLQNAVVLLLPRLPSGPPVQKALEKTGRRMGMLTATMPTMVSRTPHSLMVRADGSPERVRTMRMRAAAMTKAPDERRRPMMIFLWCKLA